MHSIYTIAKYIDGYNPKATDIIDTSLQKFAYQYNNPKLDDTIESKIKYLKHDQSLMPKELSDDANFDSKVSTSSTVSFFIDYYAKEFINQGYSPEYALYNILRLLDLMKEYEKSDYLPDLFREFKRKFINEFSPTKDTVELPKKTMPKLIKLLKKYMRGGNIREYLYSEEDVNYRDNKNNQPDDRALGLSGTIGAGMAASQYNTDTISDKKTSNIMPVEDITRVAKEAGFNGEALATAVAIALAESSGNSNSVGDESLVDSTWGPSIGLWQIRSINSEKGKGTYRDINKLFDPGFNAEAAYNISGGGKNFKPWTMWKNGTYKKYLSRAKEFSGG